MTPAGLTSRLAARWVADAATLPWRGIEGTAVLADLSGFTRLTESLTDTGGEGVETLHRVLTLCFGALLGPSLDLGGDILGFAGDAALVWFDGEDHVGRGVEAAAAMPIGLAGLPASATGGSRLQVSVGVNSGEFDAVLVGTTQRSVIVCGPAASTLVMLQSAAGPGKVLLSPEVAGAIAPTRRGQVVGPGVELRRGRKTSDPATGRSAVRSATLGAGASEHGFPGADVTGTRSLLSPAVWDLVGGDDQASDHRSAAIGFVEVRGLGAVMADGGRPALHGALDKVVTTVVDITDELGVNWLDVDIGVDSVKLLLTAGAPRSIADDEDRLLLAMHRIVSRCPVPVRGGAQRGRVFGTTLGISTRRTYTVLGDPVNVAARALGLAGDGEVVVGDGLGVDGRDHVVASFLGPISLKNRVRPMPMWRLDDVRRPTTSMRAIEASVEGGRRAEWRTLTFAWKSTVDGIAGRQVLVVGEPGMGASTLLAAAVDLAGAAATAIVADPFRQFVPYAAVIDIAHELARSVPGDPGEPLAWLLSHADRLSPERQAWVSDAAAAMAGRDSAAGSDPLNTAMRTRAVAVDLLQLASPRPWLLAIDGIDRIDPSSRAVLDELSIRLASERVMVLASAATAAGLDTTPRSDHTSIIELEPLPDAASTELVIELAPTLRDDQVERVVAAAGGNPFVLAELARWSSNSDAPGPLPDSLQRLGASLVDALPVGARAMVRDASAFGETVPLGTIAAVLERPELAEPDRWLATFPIMRAGASGAIEFRHQALRAAAHESMPFRRRRMLHAAIADHLRSSGGSTAAVLAYHDEQAGRLNEAYSAARFAGLGAKRAGAMAEACELLAQAVRLASAVAPHAVGELELERGEALVLLGDLDGAEAAFGRCARRLSDPVMFARMCHQRAGIELTRSRYQRARPWIRKGLRALAPYGDEAAEPRGRLLLDHAAVLDLGGRHRASLEPADAVLALAEATANPVLAGLAHLHLGMAYVAMMDLAALTHVEAAVAIFESIGHDRYLNSSLNNSGLVAMYLGRWDDAIDRYRRAAEHGDRCGNAADRAIVEMNIGFLLFRQGHLADAAVHGRRSLRTFDTVGVPQQSAVARYLLSEVAAAAGGLDEAAAAMASARATFVALGDAAMVADCDVTSMAQLVTSGRVDAARAMISRITPQLTAAEVPVRIMFERTVGQIESLDGDPAGPARIVDALDVARRHQLAYDEYLCLVALTADSDPRDAHDDLRNDLRNDLHEDLHDAWRDARDALADRLGVVGHASR